ncbi:MAG: NUDIX hydrolase [Chloroflexaceae bacterium]|nr:NUDIX hydrolase [Chloroflexaceae bacterium]
MPLSAEREAEIASLSARYGSPRRIVVALPSNTFDPLAKTDRIGEVCMVVRRTDGCLVLGRKTFYPPGTYRLLTGGIDHGEPIEAALLRETYEETGLDVVVRRFLGILDYLVVPGREETSSEKEFYTFAFLLDEVGGVLECLDEHENHEDFRCVLPQELPAIADMLEHVADQIDEEIGGSWRHWGIFRAAVHRVVFDALQENTE